MQPQQRIELSAKPTSFSQMLGLLIGQETNHSASFANPSISELHKTINVPEHRLFASHKAIYEIQQEITSLPKNTSPNLISSAQGQDMAGQHLIF